jgi:hypothetical protein
MGIDALFSVGAVPKPSIETLLYSIEEMGTDDISTLCGFPIAVTRVSVNVNLCGFSLDSQIVRILASFALFTDSGLEVGAED